MMRALPAWALSLAAWLTSFVATGCTPSVSVDAANTSGVEDGSSAHPYSTIQHAIDGTSGAVQITIAPGTYQGFSLANRNDVRFGRATTTSPVIDATATSAPAVTVSGSTGVEIVGLTIHVADGEGMHLETASEVLFASGRIDAPTDPNESILVTVLSGSAVTLDAATLFGGDIGIWTQDANSSVVLENGTVLDSSDSGMFAISGARVAIHGSTIRSTSTHAVVVRNTGTTLTIDEASALSNTPFFGVIATDGASGTLDGVTMSNSNVIAQDAGTKVVVTDSDIGGGSTYTTAAATYGGQLDLSNCRVDHGVYGLSAELAGSLLVLRNGTVVRDSGYGARTYGGGALIVDGSTITASGGEGILAYQSAASPASPNVIVRNGSTVSGNGASGLAIEPKNTLLVTDSTIEQNRGDGVWCNGGICDVGDGAGHGNTIANHDTVGTFGVHCTNSGVAHCTAGENTFSGNATDIDPACAATCQH